MVQGQVVDTESAREFMRETLGQITEAELRVIAAELETKHEQFRRALSPSALPRLSAETLRGVLRRVFATRRRAPDLLDRLGAERLAAWIRDLLEGDAPVEARLESFCERLGALPARVRHDLGSELLHFREPERYWLWTRWVWDPQTRTGALPLVTMEEYDLGGVTVGDTYLRVGRAIAFVHETGHAAGFTRIGDGPFGVDVYLACVYGVYVYTTVRMRMTQEFNRVIPALPELCRRLLGVHRMGL